MELKLLMPMKDGGEEHNYLCPQCKHSQTYVLKPQAASVGET
jgi:hypothetical protein